MAKKNTYDSEADVIELTTPEATIIDLTEIVQPARKPADTAEVDFNDELTDFIGTNGALDAQPELDSLLSDLGGSVESATPSDSASARAGAPGDFAGLMEDAVASSSENDAVGALIDDLNPPPNGDASDAAGAEPQEELDSLLDSLFSSPAATRIASATGEATEEVSVEPIPPAPEAGPDAAPDEDGASSVAKDVFGDLDSLLDGLDDLDGPAPAAAPAASVPAPEAKPSAAKPSSAKPTPAPQAAQAAAPVEDAFPDLDSLLDGLDDLDSPTPAAAPAASVSAPERAAPASEAKPSAAKPAPASKAKSSAKDIFADFDALLNGGGSPAPAATPAAPVSAPEGAAPVSEAKPSAVQLSPAKPSPAPRAAQAAAPVEDAFPDLDSLLAGLDDLDSPTAASPSAPRAPAASVPEPTPEPVLPEQAPVRKPEARDEDVLDELDLLLDGVEGQPETPMKHDDTAEIDAILDEALVPEDAAASVTPTLDILLPDEEADPALSAEDTIADEDALGAAPVEVRSEDPESGADMPQADRLQEQPDQDTRAEPSATFSEPASEEADLSGNPEEVLRNIDELLEYAPDAPLVSDNQALQPVEEDARSADALTTAPRNVGVDPAAAARLTTCEQRLEELDGRLAALESALEQPESSDVPEVDPQAITEDVLTRVRADLAAEQTAANERSASDLRDLGARLDAVEAARAQDAARPVELSSDQVEAVAARVETLLADRLALALEDRLAERLGERLAANLKDRLAADLPEVMEARLADALREPICEAAVERTRERLLPALEKEMAVAERKAEEETSFALVEMENRITALEGRPTAKWPNTAKLAEEVLDRLHGDIDRMAAESASRVLREEIAALVRGLA